MKTKLVFLFYLCICNYAFCQIEIMKDFDLGKNGVGFKTERILDYARAYGNDHRSIQLFVWYPTTKKSGQKLKYEEYFALNNPGGALQNKDSRKINVDSLLQQDIKGLKATDSIDIKLSSYKKLKTIAQKNASIKEGNYPLFIFAPGGNTPNYLHSVIAEYLASHGYIVVSFPSLGNAPSNRWPFNQIGLNLHIDDMSLIINHFKKAWKEVSIKKTGLISWSVGGVSQSIYGLKNSNINMFISLDSGIGRTYGIEMLKKSTYFDYAKFHIPYLHITGNQPDPFVVEKNSEFFDSIPSKKKFSLKIGPFSHQHFTSNRGIIPWVASGKKKEIAKAYIEMCKMVLTFSNLHLQKNDANNEQEWLKILSKQ